MASLVFNLKLSHVSYVSLDYLDDVSVLASVALSFIYMYVWDVALFDIKPFGVRSLLIFCRHLKVSILTE